MHHAQIEFERPEYEFLLAEARRLGTAVAGLVRSYVAERMAARPVGNDLADDDSTEDDPFEGIIGAGKGTGEAVGRNHDDYLYGPRVR